MERHDVKTRRLIPTLILGAALVLPTACSGADATSEITVTDVRVPVPAGTNGAAYMTVANDGDSDDRLTSVASDIADTTELHETSIEGGSMAMNPVDGIDIPAGSEVVLEPGGLHAMLIGVTDDLAEGDTVDLTLTFDRAGEQTVPAMVVPTGDLAPMDMASEGMEMGSEPTHVASEG
jgi:copper(I)-binding protein